MMAQQDFPIEELLDFIEDGQERCLAVLYHGMIDDSADRDRQKVVISGALIGDRNQWESLRVSWRKRLSLDDIAYFKSSECKNLRGEFFKYRSETNYPLPEGRQTADRMRNDLDAIIRECKLVGVACIIPMPLWRKLQADSLYAPLVAKDPYHWAVQTVWTLSAHTMKALGRGNIVTFAHDDCDHFHILHALYKGYKERNRKDARVMAEFIPLDDKTNPPIQAADVATSVTQELAMEWVDNPTTATLKRLRDSMYKIAHWDEDFARTVLDIELDRITAPAS
jgi:hypothetical protein